MCKFILRLLGISKKEEEEEQTEMIKEETMNVSSPKIILDFGHGKDTPGKKSPDCRLEEWKFNRELGMIIYEGLKKQGYNPVILVPEDIDIGLPERCARVNEMCKVESCILISIHGNAAGNGSSWLNASGWQCHTTIGETRADILAKYLYEAAHEILDPLKIGVREYNGSNEPDWENDFYILKHTICPSVLIENLFYDNKKDIEIMLSDEGKQILANVTIEGIKRYVNSETK